MACELKKQNEKYTITLIYYIQDMYDWEETLGWNVVSRITIAYDCLRVTQRLNVAK